MQVELGNNWGYMVIPENFSQNFGDLLLAKQYAMNESIEGSRVPIYLDYSRIILSNNLHIYVYEIFLYEILSISVF